MGYPHKVTFKAKLAIIKTRVFSHLKGTHIHAFLPNIGRLYVSYHIFFRGIRFVKLYSTQRWDVYVDGNLLKIKNGRNEAWQ